MMFSRLLASVVLFTYFATSAHGDNPPLDPNEVDALKQIAKTLGKTDWKFYGVDPCSGREGWLTKNPREGYNNSVTCGFCSSNNNSNLLHVTNIILKEQNLNGILPPELVKLPCLKEFDVSRNHLSGTIPPEWASLQLVQISLLGNRINGSIPKEIGNISTLESLVLEFNQLSGTIPDELGNLSGIKRMHLTSNFFSGELPEPLSKLINLEEFRIGDNNFTGKIPDFIGNWRNLTQLMIQASGLEGPIPSSIAKLTNMNDLRISDLHGTEMTFPDLKDMTSLKRLILRNCKISGTLQEYLGSFKSLKTLDLSFNKLRGAIPSSFGDLSADFIFLTGNLLSGPLPDQMRNVAYQQSLDLSYNNFSSGYQNCSQSTVNWFASSSPHAAFGNVACINRCSRRWSAFHINCGGDEYRNKNIKYEADTNSSGPSTLSTSGENWALSSTGFFLDNEHHPRIVTSSSSLFMKNSQLYTNARISPLSLTYFGFCLENGNYIVKLHFAEIVISGDNTYRSLGRRIFDIYIQGQRVQQDFNIEAAAGGIGKETIQSFTANVTNNTLEIRFYWAGKGTTSIPEKGTYGPLISAISVNNPDYESSKHISAGSIVGIVAAVASIICVLLCILWWKGILCHNPMENDLKGLDLKTGSFTLRQIKAATHNFDAANKIGEGGFGSVYKGLLLDGTMIAVKQLSSKSKQGNREFVNEIGMISALQHPHLVKLYGCCVEGSQLLLIYEYMENNSLARALFGPEEHQLKLDWPTRRKICIGVARGLAYLHEESRIKVVHRDIKATNVLLDKDLNPKISDFGLARLDEEENTHISTRIAGTYGYMAPEYAMWGYLTDKADVYSFGVVTLEIVSGKSATTYKKMDETYNLLEWALGLKEKGNLMELVDPRLESDFNEEEVMVIINVALLCTNATAAVRPSMSSVVSILEGKLVFGPNFSFDDYKTALEKTDEKFEHSPATKMSDSLISSSVSLDGPLTTSTSAADLYPVNISSEYLRERDL